MTPDISLLIERLAGRPEIFCDHRYGYVQDECVNCGHLKGSIEYHVRIGNVLQELEKKQGVLDEKGMLTLMSAAKELLSIIRLWRECGFTKSLQEILNESGWEEAPIKLLAMDKPPETAMADIEYRLKDPNARQLFDFLSTLFPHEKV